MSTLLFINKKILRCLEQNKIENGWKTCSEYFIKEYENSIKNIKEKIKENEYGGYYGLYNNDSKKFCIKTPDIEDKGKNYSKIKTGQVCGTGDWDRKSLTNLVVNIFKIPIPLSIKLPQEFIEKHKKILNKVEVLTKLQLKNEIIKNKYVKDMYKDDLNIEQLKRILYWGSQQIKLICIVLQNWLDENELLIPDPNCGTQRKKKKL
jgi:hypothetical protein